MAVRRGEGRRGAWVQGAGSAGTLRGGAGTLRGRGAGTLRGGGERG